LSPRAKETHSAKTVEARANLANSASNKLTDERGQFQQLRAALETRANLAEAERDRLRAELSALHGSAPLRLRNWLARSPALVAVYRTLSRLVTNRSFG
jgi:hypothetical protein